MLKWKRILNFLRLLPHLWFILGLRWPWLMLKRQLDNIAPLQMSQMCFKSCWRAEGSLEQLILGHLKWEDWDRQPNPRHTVEMCLKTRVCSTFPCNVCAEQSLRAGTAWAQLEWRWLNNHPQAGFFFGEWNLLGCIWFFQSLFPGFQRLNSGFFPPEQLQAGAPTAQQELRWVWGVQN